MSIFWNIDSYLSVIEKPLGILTSGTVNCGNGIYLLKAGTPISNAGAVANTGDAKYLVAEDFYFYSNTPTQPKLVKLIETGYVDINAAEAAAGITYADAAKTALATAGIVLVDGALEAGGGGGSGVLVVNATLDMEHAESEEQIPLIIDKTMAEMFAAEYTFLSIDVGEGEAFYTLPECSRYGTGDYGTLNWSVSVDGGVFAALASYDGETLTAILEAIESGGPDETDEFTVYDTQYSGNYGATDTHTVSDPENAKQAIFTFNFGYGEADQKLSGTAEARLVSCTTSGDSTTLVYEAIVEKNGELWCVTVTSVDSSGSRTNTVRVVRYPVDNAPLVAHATVDADALSSTPTPITLDKTLSDLTAADISYVVLLLTSDDEEVGRYVVPVTAVFGPSVIYRLDTGEGVATVLVTSQGATATFA